MKLVQQNPYRIVGLLSNASLRETLNRKNKIKAFSSVGKEVPSDYDFPFLEAIKRENGTIENAFSKIEQNKNKVLHSIFWFANGNAFDSTALDYLKAGDEEKTLDIWEKVTDGKEISNKNFTSFNNLGTLYLATQKVKEGIQLKLKLLESNSFDDFINIVADENYTLNEQERTHLFIDELVSILKESYTQNQIIQLFKNTTKSAKDYITKIFSSDAIHTIEVILKKTSKKRQNNKLEAYKYGKELLSKTKTELNQLKSILGTSDLQYKMLADNVAKEILQCAIDYFNENDDRESNGDYLKESLELANSAQTIAVKDMTKDRIKDNIRTLEGMKERELNRAIAILNSIKLAYEKAVNEIDAQVAIMQMRMSYNQSINYSKVDKMKAECLDWNKVVEVVNDGISAKDVEIIQRSTNQSKISEYKSLVDFLFNKLGPFQINQIKHICYWKDVRAAQAKSTAKQVGNTVSSATEGCYIATMVYGDYSHPQVLKLRSFRDGTLSKSYLGRTFIKVYYRYSPLWVERLKDKPKINEVIHKLLDHFIKIISK